jgi:threonine synthase
MYSIQASGCAPIVKAFADGEAAAAEFLNAQTVASGLRVPKALGDFLMLKILRDSGGGAVAVDDVQMIEATRKVGSAEGIFVAPEGAACFAALPQLEKHISTTDRVVIFNTGAGVKYLDLFAE